MLRQRFFLNRRILGIAVVAVVAGVSFLSSSTIPHASAATGPLVWSDEFNGPAGSAPDTGKWGRDLGGGGFGNNELEYYTNGAANAAMDGQGNLVITTRKENPAGYQCWYGSCQYTSARLNTAGRFTQQYGHIEARIKMPRGQGIWPAFWALGDNIGSVGWPASGEIDIMESAGRTPSTNYGSLHGPGYSGGNPLSGSYTLPGGQKFADDFHTFAVDWSPNVVTWSVDGNQYSRHTSADTNGNPWVYNHAFFLILNVAVGGTFPGNPDGSSTYPQRMLVDYVRVYAPDSGGGGGGGGTITGYGGKCVDVAGANSANGTQVQLYTCNGTNAQKWTQTAGTLRALGKCLDVSGAGTANGTRVQLYDCNGTNAQRWTVGTDGTLRAMGKCLDATGVSSADGTPLQIWDCTGGANQKWSIKA